MKFPLKVGALGYQGFPNWGFLQERFGLTLEGGYAKVKLVFCENSREISWDFEPFNRVVSTPGFLRK